MNGFVLLASFFILLILHELGHYIVAVHLNKFGGWIINFTMIGVKPKFPISVSEANFIFLAGVLFSLPFGLFISILFNQWIYFFAVFMLGAWDLLLIYLIILKKKANPFFNELNERHAVYYKLTIIEQKVFE